MDHKRADEFLVKEAAARMKRRPAQVTDLPTIDPGEDEVTAVPCVIPNWSWHHHGDMMADEEALLLPVGDGPMVAALDPDVQDTGTEQRP